MSKRESKCTTELKKGFTKAGIFFHKISDMPHLPGMMRFDLKKPFDAFAVIPPEIADPILGTYGLPVAIEAKAIKRGSFPFSSLRPNQIEGLTRFEARRAGRSFVVLFVRDTEPYINRCYVFPWWVIKEAMDAGQKSFSWRVLDMMPYAGGQSGTYDMDRVLQLMCGGKYVGGSS